MPNVYLREKQTTFAQRLIDKFSKNIRLLELVHRALPVHIGQALSCSSSLIHDCQHRVTQLDRSVNMLAFTNYSTITERLGYASNVTMSNVYEKAPTFKYFHTALKMLYTSLGLM